MSSSQKPGTDWRELVAADEAERFSAYAAEFAAIQKRKSARHGQGRALHRKQLAAVRGWLDVAADLPEFARHGLFAVPGRHEAWVRLSNGGMDRAADRTPDVRGFAIRVFGVEGDSALGNGPALSQDFTLINQEAFAFPRSDEFVAFVVAASKGGGALLKHLIRRYGLFGGPRRLGGMIKNLGKPFGSFGTERLFTAVPFACGPYAVRARLVPASGNGAPQPQAREDWGADFAKRLAAGPLKWEFQLQPWVSEDVTPIEDASVNWPTPYTTVATLELPQQDLSDAQATAFAQQAEASVFDPWQALAAHRPLGDVQRARKVIYFESQKGRGAA